MLFSSWEPLFPQDCPTRNLQNDFWKLSQRRLHSILCAPMNRPNTMHPPSASQVPLRQLQMNAFVCGYFERASSMNALHLLAHFYLACLILEIRLNGGGRLFAGNQPIEYLPFSPSYFTKFLKKMCAKIWSRMATWGGGESIKSPLVAKGEHKREYQRSPRAWKAPRLPKEHLERTKKCFKALDTVTKNSNTWPRSIQIGRETT